MKEINPAKWHVAFCVEFIDFDFLEIEDVPESKGKELNKSL